MILRVHYLEDGAELVNFLIELLEGCVLQAEAWFMVSDFLASCSSDTLVVVPECCSQLPVRGSILPMWEEGPLGPFVPVIVPLSRRTRSGWQHLGY